MKVRCLKEMRIPPYSAQPGDILEVEETVAIMLLAHGTVEKVKGKEPALKLSEPLVEANTASPAEVTSTRAKSRSK